jgi:hypothetical protein
VNGDKLQQNPVVTEVRIAATNGAPRGLTTVLLKERMSPTLRGKAGLPQELHLQAFRDPCSVD